MPNDFIEKYRSLRKEDREARDQGYKNSYGDAWSYFSADNPLFSEKNVSNSGKNVLNGIAVLGSPIGLLRGILQTGGTAAVQGLDNVGRGANDFFSAWAESMNGGHGKIEPMSKEETLKQFSNNVANSTINVKDANDVDFTKKFNVTDKGTGEGKTIEVGYKKDKDGNLKIATVYDESYDGRGSGFSMLKKNIKLLKQVDKMTKPEYWERKDGIRVLREVPLSNKEKQEKYNELLEQDRRNSSRIFGQDNLNKYFKNSFSIDTGEYEISDEDNNKVTYNIGKSGSQYNPNSMFRMK